MYSQNVSDWLTIDCLIVYKVLPNSHCLSHLLAPEKHPLGLRPRGHRYTLPICPNKLCKSSFIPRSLFSFLWFCFIYSVLYYHNICICHCLIKRYHHACVPWVPCEEVGCSSRAAELTGLVSSPETHPLVSHLALLIASPATATRKHTKDTDTASNSAMAETGLTPNEIQKCFTGSIITPLLVRRPFHIMPCPNSYHKYSPGR